MVLSSVMEEKEKIIGWKIIYKYLASSSSSEEEERNNKRTLLVKDSP